MPIVKRSISQPWHYADGQMFVHSPSSVVLQDVAVAGMCGSLAQLGYLSAYASEMFEDLFKFANSLNARIADINARTARLRAQIPSVESTISGAGFKLELGAAKLDRGEEPQTQLFLPDSKPTAIRTRYESPEVFRVPPLKDVDPVLLPTTLVEHGPCAAAYSNPEFFVNEWRKAEEARLKKLQEERAARKQERRERRQRERERKAKEQETSQLKREKKKDLNWRNRYNTEDQMGNTLARSLARTPSGLVETKSNFGSSLPSPRQAARNAVPDIEVPLPAESETEERIPTPILSYDEYDSNEALPDSLLHPNPTALPPDVEQRLSFSAAKVGGSPIFFPGAVPPPAPPASKSLAAPPPPMPAAPRPPPPPPSLPAPPPLPTGAGALMASIQTGKKLREVEPQTAPKPVNPQANLLSAIRTGSSNLKKVETASAGATQKPADKALGAFAGSAVTDILERRKYLQDEDSEASDDDDDDWN